MPYKDKEKNAESIKNAIARNYISSCTVRFRKDDEPFYNAIQKGSEADSVTVAEYLRISAKEKLIREGYLQENKDAE